MTDQKDRACIRSSWFAVAALALCACSGAGESERAPDTVGASGGGGLAGGGSSSLGGSTSASGSSSSGGSSSSAGSAGPGAQTGGASGTDQGECDTVCFNWEPRTLVEPPSGAPNTEFVSEGCNSLGLLPGSCPSGFECGDEFTADLGIFRYILPVCQSTRTTSYHFDVSLPAEIEGDVTVTLIPKLNGLPWPNGQGYAGRLRLTGMEGQGMMDVPLPLSSADEIVLRVPRGDYSVRAELLDLGTQDLDDTVYPTMYKVGSLRVREPGRADVNFEAVRVAYQVTLDNAPLGILSSAQPLALSLANEYGETWSPSFTQGDVPSGAVWLPPGTYTGVAIAYGSEEAYGLFPGASVLQPIEVIGSTVEVTINVETTEVHGSVRVDGLDLPLAADRGRVVFVSRSGGAQRSIPLSETGTATFQGRVYSGIYDVFFDATGSEMPDVPAMATVAASGYVPGDVLPIALTTSLVSIGLTINDGPMLDAATSRGGFIFATGNASFRVNLSNAGPALANTRLFDGVYRLSYQPTGDEIVAFGNWTLANEYVAGEAHQAFNLDVAQFTSTVTHNGEAPPDAGALSRGMLLAQRLEQVPGASSTQVVAYWSPEGPLSATLRLPHGRWRFDHYLYTGGEALGMPNGRTTLGTVDLAQDLVRAYDVQSVQVSGNVSLGGAPFPEATGAGNRGTIQLVTHFGSSTQETLPGTGEAAYNFRVYRGVYNLLYACDPLKDCDSAFAPAPASYVWWGVDIR